jgi:hypothetical protein
MLTRKDYEYVSVSCDACFLLCVCVSKLQHGGRTYYRSILRWTNRNIKNLEEIWWATFNFSYLLIKLIILSIALYKHVCFWNNIFIFANTCLYLSCKLWKSSVLWVVYTTALLHDVTTQRTMTSVFIVVTISNLKYMPFKIKLISLGDGIWIRGTVIQNEIRRCYELWIQFIESLRIITQHEAFLCLIIMSWTTACVAETFVLPARAQMLASSGCEDV